MKYYYRLLFVLVISPFFLSFQAKKEYHLKWGLAKDEYAVYNVTSKSEKTRFILFGSDLNEDGTNSLLVNTSKEMAYRMIFILPKDPVKAGSSWNVEQPVDNYVFATQLIKGIIQGRYTLKRIQKEKKGNDEKEVVLIEANLNINRLTCEAKTDKLMRTDAIGTIKANLYFTTTKTVLTKADIAINIKSGGIAGGPLFEAINVSEHLELEYIKARKEDDTEFHKNVKDAIEQGVKFLQSKQSRDGTFEGEPFPPYTIPKPGYTALALMALIHSGVKTDDPMIQKGFESIVNDFKKSSVKQTYNVAVLIMAMETKYLPIEKYEQMAQFSEQAAKELIRKEITKEDLEIVKEATKWLINNQTKNGTWGYPEHSNIYDHSNTQYALLALKSASRCGAEISDDVWRRSADHFIKQQLFDTDEEEIVLNLTLFGEHQGTGETGETKPQLKAKPGGWGYLVNQAEGDRKYAAMTCAGLTSLRICESELYEHGKLDNELKQKIDKAKNSGLAWLQKNFSVRGNISCNHFAAKDWLYYLFSLERVGVLFGIKKLIDHDWYFEGATILLSCQKKDGSWEPTSHYAPVVSTAFALLFLKRATLQVATPK